MMYIYGNIHIGKRFQKSSPCPGGILLDIPWPSSRSIEVDEIILQNLRNVFFLWEFFHKWPQRKIPPDVGVGFLRCGGCFLKQPQVSSPGIQLPEKFRSRVRSPATYPQKCPSACRYIHYTCIYCIYVVSIHINKPCAM